MRFVIRALFSSIVAMLVVGCGATFKPMPDAKPVTALEPPSYHQGDVYIYDDGYVEYVSGVEGNVIKWKTSSKLTSYFSSKTPFMPRLSWQNDKVKVRMDGAVDSQWLWPLHAGKNMSFKTSYQVQKLSGQPAGRYDYDWRCRVEGAKKVRVPAGSFDA